VRFITGHQQNGEPVVHDWQSLANPDCTLVIYMGLANLSLIVRDLLASGRSKDTPAAIIENGTTPRQRKVVTTIGDLQQAAHEHAIESPAMLIIGPVVSLAAELDWFVPWVEEAKRLYA
jgi:uroporphyrin-III C-methyltransferase/precorrin-2 dehydrogenase/sirohydrochlorin ferrochelatase/uroporphyrin-III C-methyltransferase